MEAWQGSLPALVAATADGVKQGDYFGPDGPGEMASFPAPGVIDAAALDTELATRLWTTAEHATGVTFPRATPALLQIVALKGYLGAVS